jgi:hypothetical protein
MFIFTWIARHPLVGFALLEVFLVLVGQFWSITRVGFEKGFGRIVTFAGHYGDMLLAGAIVTISLILYEQRYKLDNAFLWGVGTMLVYGLSAYIAQKFLPPPRIEDCYHNFVVLPAFVLLFGGGGILCILSMAKSGWDDRFWFVIFALIAWLVLLCVDIKYGRLKQDEFMQKHWGVTI